MAKVKTQELTGMALDWAVIVALYGKHDASDPAHVQHFKDSRAGHPLHQRAHYSTAWAEGGPIIDRERISLNEHKGAWMAMRHKNGIPQERAFGPTPLTAAMRCFVLSKLGAEVEIPEGAL